MATIPTKPDLDVTSLSARTGVPAWPEEQSVSARSNNPAQDRTKDFAESTSAKPSQRDALQALLAFSALHDQVRRRKALAARKNGFDAGTPVAELAPPDLAPEFEQDEQFVLDEVLQLVAERAVAITGADGLAIALAENNEIVLRASAGTVRPDVGARIDRDSAFSGACFKTAQVVNCDDTETDPRVNIEACRKLGARSMVAVPLCGRRRVIGLLEAFSSWPFGFNDTDIRNLSLLAELILGAVKPEDEDRFAHSAQVAATKLESPRIPAKVPSAVVPSQAAHVAPEVLPVVVPADVPADVRVVVPVDVPIVVSVSDPKVADKTAENKPSEAKIDSASVVARLNQTVIENVAKAETTKPEIKNTETAKPEIKKAEVKTSEAKKPALAIAAATSAPTKISVAEPEAAKRTLPTILLICVVIAAAFAGGVWWKLKTAQLGGAMIQSENMRTDELEGGRTNGDREKDEREKDAMIAPSNTPAPPPNSITAPNAALDAASEAALPNNTPASAQELSKFPRVTGVRHWSSGDSSTVVLDLQDQVQYEAHRLAGPDRIYFDLRDTQLASDLISKSIEVGDTFVNRIRMAQPVAGMTRVVLETKANSTFSVSLEPNPYRLVVEVRKIGATPKAAVNLFPNAAVPEKKQLAIVIPPPTKEDLQLRARVPKMRIVVDAGHGGWDLGTVGRRGLLEKDLVLEIAQRLGKLLESRLGMEVVYTRQDDNYIPLDERASIANQSQADLFVSVHANYSDLPSARGVETYYTNFFSAPGTKDLDTHVTIGGGKGPVTTSLSPADLHDRIEQSRRLAASVQRSLYGTLSIQNPGLRDRGIKEAGFVVLTESAMPGILAEVSFVSSPTDEQKLRSDGYREQIAEALYRGIARYAASSHAVKVAAR